MVKLQIPQRFKPPFLSEDTARMFIKLIGPIQNFIGASSIQYLNLRILIDNGQFKFKIVNDYNRKFNYAINEYVKSLLRTYSDGILTTVIIIHIIFIGNIFEK
jgi:hypothetical protein